jgi:hypothetical protein
MNIVNKEIKSYIKYLIEDKNAQFFSDLDSIHKDKLVAEAMASLGNDVDIVLNQNANRLLTSLLLVKNHETENDLINEIKQSSYDFFESHFDKIISDFRDEIFAEKMCDLGMSSFIDRQTGETLWRKSA